MFTQCVICNTRDKVDYKQEQFIEENRLEYKKTNKCFKICVACSRIMKLNSEEIIYEK